MERTAFLTCLSDQYPGLLEAAESTFSHDTALTGVSTMSVINECTTSAAANPVVSPGLSYIGETSTAGELAIGLLKIGIGILVLTNIRSNQF